MTARRSEEDFGLPLLEPDADLENGMDTNAGYESLPEGSHHSSEGPEWLSEPHGPLRDSSAPISGPERAAYVKLSRSVKRSTAAARARYFDVSSFSSSHPWLFSACPNRPVHSNKSYLLSQATSMDMLGRGRQAHANACGQTGRHCQNRPAHPYS